MFKKGCYITDSTNVTTTQYFVSIQCDLKGNPILELLTLKLHIIIVYFLSVGLLSIANLYVTQGDANVNPIMNKKLLTGILPRKGRMNHTDKGYWSKENIRKNKELGLQPNIVPKEGFDRSLTLKTAIEEYDNDEIKQCRGLIEGIRQDAETAYCFNGILT